MLVRPRPLSKWFVKCKKTKRFLFSTFYLGGKSELKIKLKLSVRVIKSKASNFNHMQCARSDFPLGRYMREGRLFEKRTEGKHRIVNER